MPILKPTICLWLRSALLLCLALSTIGAIAQTPAAPKAVATPTIKLHIVGGLNGQNQYTHHEKPFWSQELARLSEGKYSADISPFDQVGIPGADMLRLLKLGVVPFGTALQSAILTQYPQFAANDLPGLNPDIASLKKVTAAFRPYLETQLRNQHNIKLLALYAYPAQVLFCKDPFTQLADLKGRRISVASLSQSDFFSAVGGVPVITSFTQIMANMTSSNIDCAVTGAMSGNTLGLHQLTSHVHTMPISWEISIFAANINAWDSLPPNLKALLSSELPKLEAAIWETSTLETFEGLACNVGTTDCRRGRKGSMIKVVLNNHDEQLRREIFSDTVLPRWLTRCGSSCFDVWKQIIEPVVGIVTKTSSH